MSSDDDLLTRAMAGRQENLSKAESDQLMEFLWQLRSGGQLSTEQRAQLRAIAAKAGVRVQ